MPKYRIKISKSSIVWEEAYATVEADNEADAEEEGYELNLWELDWRRVDAYGQDMEVEIIEELVSCP